MLALELPVEIERQFREVVQKNYQGNMREAFTALLRIHDKYGWKVQLAEDVGTIRKEVQKAGGINSQKIDDAIARYRNNKKN